MNDLKKIPFSYTIEKNDLRRDRETVLKEKHSVIPVLGVNNRQMNQDFLEKTLGMTVQLEEGPFAEFGDRNNSDIKLVLMESPSYRTRAVEGLKKLNKIIIKAAASTEIESLLARGASYEKLYQGVKGYAFETVSPEGDTFLLHAEDSVADLKEIVAEVLFTEHPDFGGLSDFIIEVIVINSPQAQAHADFYKSIFPEQDFLQFNEANGADLLVEADKVWDLSGLRFSVAEDVDWDLLEEKLIKPIFKDRRGRFIQTTDPSGIELWFEK